MSLDIGGVFSGALDRTTSRDGLLAIAIAWIGLGISSAGGTISEGETAGLLITGGVLQLIGAIAMIVVQILAFRLLYKASDDGFTDDVTRSLGITFLYVFVASIAVGIATVLGLLLFVIPGIFLMISLILTLPVIAIEDRGPIAGMERAWSLAKGNRVEFLLIGIVAVSAQFAAIFFETFVSALVMVPIFSAIPSTGGYVLAGVVSMLFAIVSAVVNVFMYGLQVDTYDQLTVDQSGDPASPSVDDDTPPGGQRQETDDPSGRSDRRDQDVGWG